MSFLPKGSAPLAMRSAELQPDSAELLEKNGAIWISRRDLLSGALTTGAVALVTSPAKARTKLTSAETRAIAKEAYIYGFPMVDNYRVQYSYFVDAAGPEFKAPWNHIHNTPRVYTPEDKAIPTPNSDTPYSALGMDLRAEPIVLTMPVIEKSRYYSVQLVDDYTYNFDYIGSRTTGNDGGNFLVAGPDWKGEKPDGIEKVYRCETQFGFAQYRTQLFDPADIENVIKVQAGYKVQTLSEFLGQPTPPAAPSIEFMKPLTREQQQTSPRFFDILSFVFQFCPPNPSEKKTLARFAKLGLGFGQKFDLANFTPEQTHALAEGMADAWKELGHLKATAVATGKVTSGDVFGTRAFLKNNYLYRMAGVALGIYGNSKEEAMYPVYLVDSTGKKLNGASNTYKLHFAADLLPPVNSFWSLTLYNLPSSLLSANVLNRYLINSPMLPGLKRDADGGLTLIIQHKSPGKDLESNWLPAPDGPFWIIIRLYWPKPEALDGAWKQPPLEAMAIN